ncbi:MAG TPA: DUF2892 domain-containing protein [Sphingomicrobium sp.]|nr:DUF2892 domain-containing protein [Sphingomicrobium sp.]
MLKNVGKVDRVARIFIGLLLCFLALTTAVDGWLETGFYIFGGYLLLTALVGSCIIYRVLDIDSHDHGGTYHSGDDPYDGRAGN